MSTLDKVREIIDRGPVHENTSLAELGMDSLSSLSVLMEIESVFDVRLSDYAFEDLYSVKDLVNAIEEKRA